MFKQITDLAGGEYYLIASLLIFLVFFALVIYYVVSMNKNYIAQMKNMPFIDDKQTHDYEKV
jgi:cbb3-type cytochrome oxidase subunit 3